MIRELDELAGSDYYKYGRYLDDGTLYIIVHPAYYVFFHDHEISYSTENPVDAFLNERAFTKSTRFLQEQERSLRDFLEITSTRKRLILLVLPGGYKDYGGYVYRGMTDGFARYINSVTNGSDSVLYLYSEKPNKGSLSQTTRQRLEGFIRAIAPKTILIGGGYLGRCMEDFYKDLTSFTSRDKVMFAGEISAFSPEDLKAMDIDDFLRDGMLNVPALKEVVSEKMKGNSLREVLRNYKNHGNNKGGKG